MKNLNMKRSKRLTGMVCMMLSIFLLTMPLLGILAVFILSATINLTVDLTQYMITERTSYYGFYQYRKKTSLGTQLH